MTESRNRLEHCPPDANLGIGLGVPQGEQNNMPTSEKKHHRVLKYPTGVCFGTEFLPTVNVSEAPFFELPYRNLKFQLNFFSEMSIIPRHKCCIASPLDAREVRMHSLVSDTAQLTLVHDTALQKYTK